MTTIHPYHLAFVKEAQEWRDKTRAKGGKPYTYRSTDGEYIALFEDEGDGMHVFELGPEIAYFTGVNENTFKFEKESK